MYRKVSLPQKLRMLRPLQIALLLFACIFMQYVSAQSFPMGISYQAVIRNSGGMELSNSFVTMEFSIRKNTIDGPIMFDESHQLIETNQFGLITTVVGGGVNTGLGVFNSLLDLDWSDDKYFLEVRAIIPGQGSAQLLGVSQLLTVPYALLAQKAETVLNEGDGDSTNELIEDFSLQGNVLTITENEVDYSVDLSPIGFATWQKSSGVVYNTLERIGIGTADPTSTLSVNGSLSVPVMNLGAGVFDMGLGNDDVHVLICNVTNGAVLVRLNSAATSAGRMYKFRKFSSVLNNTNPVEVIPVTGQMIDGVSSYQMSHNAAEYLTIISDGIGWYVIDHSKD